MGFSDDHIIQRLNPLRFGLGFQIVGGDVDVADEVEKDIFAGENSKDVIFLCLANCFGFLPLLSGCHFHLLQAVLFSCEPSLVEGLPLWPEAAGR